MRWRSCYAPSCTTRALWGSPLVCRSFALCACEAKLGPSACYASQYKTVLLTLVDKYSFRSRDSRKRLYPATD
eukprot:4417102-Ditylum_brightwellii.AAC.1